MSAGTEHRQVQRVRSGLGGITPERGRSAAVCVRLQRMLPETASPPPLISPAPTPAETAAIVVAIERFARDTAPAPPRPLAAGGGEWLAAARAEAVARAPGRTGGAGVWQR